MITQPGTERRVQVMLPGQAAAPDGPIDMTMMYVMHHGFRRDLTSFVAAAKATPVDDQPTWRALARRWELFSLVLRHHHRSEDAGVWPLLMDRADADGQAMLQAMEDEHAEIDSLLRTCADGFHFLVEQPSEDIRAALVVRLTATRESLGRHLAHEETDALALVQQVMSVQEWGAIGEKHFKAGVSVRDLTRLVPWAGSRLPADVRKRMLADAGLAFHALWLLTRSGFERQERRAFRHM